MNDQATQNWCRLHDWGRAAIYGARALHILIEKIRRDHGS